MHSILFGAKRAFHASVYRLSRPLLAPFGLTPARFDLLFAVFGDPEPRELRRGAPRQKFQSALARELGVTRMTISRMVRSLEELRLVERRRVSFDRRQWDVTLTASGLRRVLRVLRELVSRGLVDLALDHAITPKRWYAPAACLEGKETIDGALHRLRRGLGDPACLAYPWHPDD